MALYTGKPRDWRTHDELQGFAGWEWPGDRDALGSRADRRSSRSLRLRGQHRQCAREHRWQCRLERDGWHDRRHASRPERHQRGRRIRRVEHMHLYLRLTRRPRLALLEDPLLRSGRFLELARARPIAREQRSSNYVAEALGLRDRRGARAWESTRIERFSHGDIGFLEVRRFGDEAPLATARVRSQSGAGASAGVRRLHVVRARSQRSHGRR
jgi:hypothetical protein